MPNRAIRSPTSEGRDDAVGAFVRRASSSTVPRRREARGGRRMPEPTRFHFAYIDAFAGASRDRPQPNRCVGRRDGGTPRSEVSRCGTMHMPGSCPPAARRRGLVTRRPGLARRPWAKNPRPNLPARSRRGGAFPPPQHSIGPPGVNGAGVTTGVSVDAPAQQVEQGSSASRRRIAPRPSEVHVVELVLLRSVADAEHVHHPTSRDLVQHDHVLRPTAPGRRAGAVRPRSRSTSSVGDRSDRASQHQR